MRKIDYVLDIGYCGCQDEGTTTVPDDMTDHEIDIMVNDMAVEWAGSWEGDERLGFDPDGSEEEQAQEAEHFYEGVSGSWHWTAEDDE